MVSSAFSPAGSFRRTPAKAAESRPPWVGVRKVASTPARRSRSASPNTSARAKPLPYNAYPYDGQPMPPRAPPPATSSTRSGESFRSTSPMDSIPRDHPPPNDGYERNVSEAFKGRLQALADLRGKMEELSEQHRREEECIMHTIDEFLQRNVSERESLRQKEGMMVGVLDQLKKEKDQALDMFQQFRDKGGGVIQRLTTTLNELQEKYVEEGKRCSDLQQQVMKLQQELRVERNTRMTLEGQMAQLQHSSGFIPSESPTTPSKPAYDSKSQGTLVQRLQELVREKDASLVVLEKRNSTLVHRLEALQKELDETKRDGGSDTGLFQQKLQMWKEKHEKTEAFYTNKLEENLRLLEEEEQLMASLHSTNEELRKEIETLRSAKGELEAKLAFLEADNGPIRYEDASKVVQQLLSPDAENSQPPEKLRGLLQNSVVNMLVQQLRAEKRQRLEMEEQSTQMLQATTKHVAQLEQRLRAAEGAAGRGTPRTGAGAPSFTSPLNDLSGPVHQVPMPDILSNTRSRSAGSDSSQGSAPSSRLQDLGREVVRSVKEDPVPLPVLPTTAPASGPTTPIQQLLSSRVRGKEVKADKQDTVPVKDSQPATRSESPSGEVKEAKEVKEEHHPSPRNTEPRSGSPMSTALADIEELLYGKKGKSAKEPPRGGEMDKDIWEFLLGGPSKAKGKKKPDGETSVFAFLKDRQEATKADLPPEQPKAEAAVPPSPTVNRMDILQRLKQHVSPDKSPRPATPPREPARGSADETSKTASPPTPTKACEDSLLLLEKQYEELVNMSRSVRS